MLCLLFIEESSHRKPVSAFVVLKILRASSAASFMALKLPHEKSAALSSGLLFSKNENRGPDSTSLFTLMARKLGICFDV